MFYDEFSRDIQSSSLKLFSLNIDNYPSYAIALKQLRDLFSCEPINIKAALTKVRRMKNMDDFVMRLIDLGTIGN